MSGGPMHPRSVLVARRVRETRDTVTLHLETRDFECAPGQFTMLYAFGVGEVPVSISAHRPDRGRIEHTIRDVGAVSHALTSLRVGESVGVRGPFGSAWPLDDAADHPVVFVAGGLGLAPLRFAIHTALARRKSHPSITVLAGARSPTEVLFAKELARFRARGADVRVTVDRAEEDWSGEVGFVTSLVENAPIDPTSYAFVCGPEVMMRAAGRALARRGVTPDRIFLSLERNMKCGVALCGHCQLGTELLCRDGPILSLARLGARLTVREL